MFAAGSMGRTGSGVRALILAVSAIVLIGAACTSTVPPKHRPSGSALPPPTFASPPPGLQGKPNIVLILADDQTLSEMSHMATVKAELTAKGMTFRNAFVVNPLCCPSRTSILTGKYSHSTDVYRNLPPHGGFKTFRPEDRSTIATWLQKAGYDTALIGKYLNGYVKPSYVPPGWNTWDVFTKTQYFKYVLSERGRRVPFGTTPTDYSTDVLGADAVTFIREAPEGRPIFLYFAPKAPHTPAIPAPKYAHALDNLPPQRPPNYNERDVSDKPSWLRGLPQLTEVQIAANDTFVRHQMETLLSVDDQVKNILGALAETHRLSNTFIVYFSDNGLENGSHRLLNKQVPYEESIHVPLIIRYDPITQLHATLSDALALNVDLAPTFAQVAGITAPGAEGMSLIPLLQRTPVDWRTEFVIEHLVETRKSGAPTFCAVRTARYKYIMYSGGDEELYDLQKDPYELHNLAAVATLAGVKAQLRADDMKLCTPRPPDWIP